MGKFWYTDSSGKRKRTAAGYDHEYKKFQSSSKAIAERSARNSARREALSSGKASKGDDTAVDHIHGVAAGNGSKNLRVITREENAGRNEKSRKRGSKRNKSTWGK